MISAEARQESLPLEVRIHAVERQLLERRQRIGSAAARIRSRVRMNSPGMLVAAVGFGVLLHQTRDRRDWSLITVLNRVYTSAALVMTLSSWMSPAQQTPVSAENRQSQQ